MNCLVIHTVTRKLKIFLSLAVFVFACNARAANSELKDFLLSCGYGTAIGGLVGLSTLAFANDPGGNLSNVARGASLGLYVGIGYGLFQHYSRQDKAQWAFVVQPKSQGMLYTRTF